VVGSVFLVWSFDQTPNELGVLEDEPGLFPELPPMFGQLAVLPPLYPGAGAGVEPDEPDPVSGCVVVGPLLFEELSVCAYATAAPLPSMIPASASPATACLSRMVMLFTSLPRL
jgi:hypothetical protein